MKALTIRQPWAQSIVEYGKNIENRSWTTRLRGWFAVHASQKRELVAFEECKVTLDPNEVAYGAIVGFARIADVITEDQVTAKTRRWFEGVYGLVLQEAIALEHPVPAVGGLGFWNMAPALERKCLERLSTSNRDRVLRGPIAGKNVAWIVKGRVDRNGEDFVRRGVEERWVTERPPTGWSEGDLLLFWKSAPRLCLVGAGRLQRVEPSDRRGQTHFHVKYLTNELPNPLAIEELRDDPVLRGASFLRRGPAGTVFPLSDAQARRIGRLVVAQNRSAPKRDLAAFRGLDWDRASERKTYPSSGELSPMGNR